MHTDKIDFRMVFRIGRKNKYRPTHTGRKGQTSTFTVFVCISRRAFSYLDFVFLDTTALLWLLLGINLCDSASAYRT